MSGAVHTLQELMRDAPMYARDTVESLSVRREQMADADMHICFSGRISPEISLTRWIVFRALGEEAEAEALSAS